MMLPRGVFSLWTATPAFRIDRGALLTHTLAVCLAGRVLREVEFVTDRRGAEIAAALGWRFDSVRLALEGFAPAGLCHIWALGKLLAILSQSSGHVHLDGDALLFRQLPERFRAGRLLAQSPDRPHYYSTPAAVAGLELLGLPIGGRAYNAGLLGGRDIFLLRDYAAEALEIAGRLPEDAGLPGTLCSMLVEQYFLGVFARRAGAAVRVLLPELPTRRQMLAAGYAHLVGAHKRRGPYVERVEARLRRDFPEALENFNVGFAVLALTAGRGNGADSSSLHPPS